MQRQRQLERCQWEFVHIRESVFYANREPELGALWRALEERGIVPRGMRSDDESGQDEDERDDGEVRGGVDSSAE